MKGEKTAKILDALSRAACASGELLDIFLTDYHTSYRLARGIRVPRRRRPSPPVELELVERQRFYNLLCKLKRDGITRHEGSRWHITKKGRSVFRALTARLAVSLPHAVYPSQPAAQWTIIAFDIPERDKRKREWLRLALKRLGFTMLQKSVWIGKVVLPQEFLHDLNSLRILPYVEILSVTKTGSLRQLA